MRRTPMEVHVPLLLVAATAVVLAVVAGAQDAREFIPSVYGMQQLRLFCDTPAKLDTVRRYANDPNFDFLRLPHGTSEPVEVLVTSNRLASFKDALRSAGIGYRVLVADMSRTIQQERQMQYSARMVRSRSRIDTGSDAEYMKYFPRYEEIKLFVEAVGKQYPDVCRVFSLGRSSEDRELVAIKFSVNGTAVDDGEVGGKPALLIDAGIHAREWVAPLTAIYIIKQLAENATNHQLFQDIDIYIAPLLNPDGYEFSHMNTSTRLWRKTRSLQPGSECQGVDANRNFDLYWNTAGAGPNPCNHLYAGSRPFSEPETRALRDFILARRDRIKTYLTFHSYGNYMLHPWGYSKKYPKNTPTLRCAAQAAASALFKVRGTRYTIGSSANVLYPAAGGSDDYAMGVAGIDLAYTVELPSKEYGFFPPTREILPIGEETFEAVKEFARYVKGEICQNIPDVEEQ